MVARDYLLDGFMRPPPIKAIQLEAARRFGIQPEAMIGSLRGRAKKHRTTIAAKHWAMAEARKRTGASLKQIAIAFGLTDHSSVAHAVRKHAAT